MNDVVKYGLIGAGVYLLWPMITGTPVAAVTAPPAGSTPAAPNPNLTAGQAAIAPVVLGLGGQGPTLLLSIVNSAFKSGSTSLTAAPTLNTTLTFQAWNYFLQQLTGVAGPDPGEISGYLPAGSTYSVMQYWTALTNYATGATPPYAPGSISGVQSSVTTGQPQMPPRFDMTEFAW